MNQKSGWTGTSPLALEVPLFNLRPSILNSVPCDGIVQSPIGGYSRHPLLLSVRCRESRTSSEGKIHRELSRPLNLKHNLEVSRDVNWSFQMMSFLPLKSSQKHDVKRLKSYLVYQLFSLHVFRDMQCEPSLAKELANHKQNPAKPSLKPCMV